MMRAGRAPRARLLPVPILGRLGPDESKMAHVVLRRRANRIADALTAAAQAMGDMVWLVGGWWS
jgi:hypothetical protein